VILAGTFRTLPCTGCGRSGRNHPAESQACGIENSDQPQSRQTRMSGEGVNGGWLRVRGTFRKSLTSAGISDKDPDPHFGQIIQNLFNNLFLGGDLTLEEFPKKRNENSATPTL
jgi:hypothetical protein